MTAFMRMDEVENREVIYFAPAPIYDCHIVPYLPTKSLTVPTIPRSYLYHGRSAPTNTDSHQPAANSHISSAASSLASSSAEVESSGKAGVVEKSPVDHHGAARLWYIGKGPLNLGFVLGVLTNQL